MSDHGAKRQRLDSIGRYSPASPPFDVAAKASGQSTKAPTHPRTPTSPPSSSMNSLLNGRSAMSATATPPGQTPPSSVATSQLSSHAATSAVLPHPLPTPASTAGMGSFANVDSDGDALMGDATGDDATRLSHLTPSNHNRQRDSIFSKNGGLRAAEGISGSQLFMIGEEKHEQSRPHGSQNLFRLYSLDPLARSVARVDPVTGEKINKLRKSYEGHIKSLQIAGKPKAVKMDNVFSAPLGVPDFEWQAHMQGKEPERRMNTDLTALAPDFSRLLDDAFAGMGPGQLPSSDATRYRAYIGTDDAVKAKPGVDVPPHRTTPLTSAAPTPSNSAAARGVRPERQGSKRHYTDAAFQGYGEGYGDDYGADSTGGEDNAQGNLKRRKLQFERTSHSVEVGGARR
jgi:hypothetical protein